MKKTIDQTSRLLLLILSLLFSTLAKADELYKFTHIICSPELNFFQVSSLSLYDVYSNESMAAKQYRELAEKYQLYSDSAATDKICQLNNQIFKIHIAYDKPQAAGACGGDNAGHLTIYANNKVILDNLPFNQACSNFNVTNVIYQGAIKELSINVKQENAGADSYKGYMLTYHENLNSVLINYESLIKRIKH